MTGEYDDLIPFGGLEQDGLHSITTLIVGIHQGVIQNDGNRLIRFTEQISRLPSFWMTPW